MSTPSLTGEFETIWADRLRSTTSAGIAAAVIVAFMVAALVIEMLVFQQTEFKQRA